MELVAVCPRGRPRGRGWANLDGVARGDVARAWWTADGGDGRLRRDALPTRADYAEPPLLPTRLMAVLSAVASSARPSGHLDREETLGVMTNATGPAARRGGAGTELDRSLVMVLVS